MSLQDEAQQLQQLLGRARHALGNDLIATDDEAWACVLDALARANMFAEKVKSAGPV